MAKRPVIANRRAAMAAAEAEAAAPEGFQPYPKAMYRKVKPSLKYPNGYQPRRVRDEADEAKHRKDGWKDSPEGMTPEKPFGHQD